MISSSNSKILEKLSKIEIDALNKESTEEPIWRTYDDFSGSF
jgi:hypothetical protein